MKLEDVIEESNMPGPQSELQEKMKLICNNTGKGNFNPQLEQLRALINRDPYVNLNWFIHFILTKRLGSPPLMWIFTDMIKKVGIKDAVSLSVQ